MGGVDEIGGLAAPPTIPAMALAYQWFEPVRDGKKRVTIREGHRDVRLGPLLFESPDKVQSQLVTVERVVYSKLEGLSDKEARQDGFATTELLMKGLRAYYPNIGMQSEVTMIYFWSESDDK
jgi:hypothetical protein